MGEYILCLTNSLLGVAHLSHLGPLCLEKHGWIFLTLSKRGLIYSCIVQSLLVMLPLSVKYLTALIVTDTEKIVQHLAGGFKD